MEKKDRKHLTEDVLNNPLLLKLSDMASDFTGTRFIVVYPQNGGWKQSYPGGSASRPDFCKVIQATKEGAKYCKMCHILMSVAACSQGLTEQRCHAGTSVLAVPITRGSDEALAVLSTCLFVPNSRKETWQEVKARGKELGARLEELKKAHDSLPEMFPDKIKMAREIMAVAVEAVKEIQTRLAVEKELLRLKSHGGAGAGIQAILGRELKEAMAVRTAKQPGRAAGKRRKRKKISPLIDVVADLVERNPGMPFTVEQIAAAARITPNHFSAMFHQYEGQCFSDFLTEKRINLAKELLKDLTLSIGEVAMKTGYDDAGYFARRFRQKVGKSPREWREALSIR